MNLKEFFKHDNLDEMQKQTLLKIESRGFWVLWVLLLAALIIESLLGFAPREMAAGMVYLYAGVRLFGPEWSECNYRISKNTDISTVCWLSARGIYSKNSK